MFLVLFFFLSLNLKAQFFKSGIDTVYKFQPGSGQNSGQSSEYFPENIFGLPDTNASSLVPSSHPRQICSIGIGGEIIVGFKNYYLFDGEGADFTIFENAFINPVTNKIFAEPAKVAVSEDGFSFIEFPYDILTLYGLAGKSPTNGKANPFDPAYSGGDSFDLATIGLKKAKYIKITDICNLLLENPENPFFDPIISGFDLDAVVGLHLLADISTSEQNKQFADVPVVISKSNFIEVIPNYPSGYFYLFNLMGKELLSGNFNERINFQLDKLASGLYLLIIKYHNKVFSYKILVSNQ